ncbi:MAG: hypothetical protein ACFCGT_12345 [Sandaracinaceae bacterium]
MVARAVVLPLLLAGSGCIPLPLALPPAKVGVGVGQVFGDPAPSQDDGRPISTSETVVELQAAIALQSVFPTQHHRRPGELLVGYSGQYFLRGSFSQRHRHGGFIGLDFFLAQEDAGNRWRSRVLLRSAAEMLWVPGVGGGPGGGGRASVAWELARFERVGDGGSGPRFEGVFQGELSIGAELFGGYYRIGAADYGLLGGGVTFRWPAAFGVGLIPLGGPTT